MRLVGSTAAAGALVALGGCSGGGPTLTSDSAKVKYAPIVQSVSVAVGEQLGLTWQRSSDPVVQQTTDGCSWFSGTFESERTISNADWIKAIAVVNSALDGEGFEKVTNVEKLTGGATGIRASENATKASLYLSSDEKAELRLAVPVSGDC